MCHLDLSDNERNRFFSAKSDTKNKGFVLLTNHPFAQLKLVAHQEWVAGTALRGIEEEKRGEDKFNYLQGRSYLINSVGAGMEADQCNIERTILTAKRGAFFIKVIRN